MHRCLQVHDIILVILGFFDSANEQRSLVSLGLACRHLFEPAMDVLWSTQEDLFNVLKCLPQDMWYITEDNDVDKMSRQMMNFSRAPALADWDRVDVYASRIQHLLSISSKYRQLSAGVMGAIIDIYDIRQCLQLKHVPFLPKLQSLRWVWDGEDRVLAALAPLLSGSRLLRLSLSVQQEQSDTRIHPAIFGAVMRNFGSNSTSLQHVVQCFKFDPPTQITDGVVQLLYKLTNLRSFECRSPLPSDTITFLSRLPHLSDLDIRLSRNLREPTLTSDFSHNFFPSLQTVHMRAKEVRRSILFLENLQSQFLKKVNMTTSARTLVLSELQDYFKALGSKNSVEKVIVQKFSGASGRTYPESFSIITSDIFTPLLRLRNITILAVSSGFAVDLDDRAIMQFATAWPNLYRLSILSEQPLPFKPRMTLEGIFAVFQKCAGIYTIALTFDPCLPSQSIMQQLVSLRVSRPELGLNLHQITVRNCGLVGDPELMAVAEFLHSMFPGCHLAIDGLKSQPLDLGAMGIQSWERVRREVRRLRQGYKARLEATVGGPVPVVEEVAVG